MIKRSIPWSSQPQYPVPPNSSLLGFPPIHLLNFRVGLVGLGERKTYTPTAITYAAGSAIFNGSTACITAETSALGIANGFALACRFKANTIGAIQSLLVKDYSADGDRCFQFRIDAAGAINFIRFDAAKSVITNITGGTVTAGRWHTAVAFYSGTGSGIYLDGRLVASDSVTTANNDVSASTPLLIGCGYSSITHANTLFLGGSISDVAVLKKIPTELCRGISNNIWQIFAPQQRTIYVSVAGATSHPSTGDLSSASAVIAGTAAHIALHPSTGSIVSASSAISGAAENTPAGSSSHPSTGSVASASATIDGTAAHVALHPSTGALASASATIAGAAAHVALHPSTGAIASAAATVSGTAAVNGQSTTATTLVITKITGTFAAGSIKVGATTVGTCTGAQTINGASTALLRAQYTNLAADVYRALITAVPGSGSILGIWMYNDVKYAFRNVADGLSAAMYKSTTSGWSLVALGRELSYTSGGTYTIAVGDTITGETSAATAVITAITVESGTLAAGTAAGRIIFASQTGTFQTETIKVGANLNVANISGNSTAITFAVPGGRFEFVNYNFGSGSKMYGVDGKNRGFEFDGTTFVPISTGMIADTPSFVKGHKSHLFYAFAGSLQHSGIGTPYTWSIVSGAAELAMGDTITGMQLQAGAADSATMTVFTRNNIKTLYGSSSSDWNLSSYKEEAGAYRYTNQQVGGTYMLDDRGITSLVTSQNFGNFEDATLTKKIQSWINARRSMSIASCIARDKNQYRLFFTDGSALFVTIDNGNPIGMMPILLTHPVTCICSLENSSGNEEIYFGSTNGYVYQMDIGTSMDGGDIEFYMNLAFNHLKSPRVLKSFKTAVLEVSGEGYGEFSLGYDLSYLSTEVVQPPTQATALSLNPLSYDSGATYDSGAVYDGVSLTPSVFHLGGDGENISLKILGSSDYGNPLRFSGALVDFIVRRRLR